MEKKTFMLRTAGLTIEVHALYETCRSICRNYLSDAPEQGTIPDIIVDIVPRNILRENEEHQKRDGGDGSGTFLYYDPGFLEYYAVYRKICEAIPGCDAFLMHGAAAAFNGAAYIFTAPSGTGKTTRANIWLREFPGSFIINGDKPFLRIEKEQVIAYGTPWCGKERKNTNVGLPLRAVFLLERAEEGEENSVKELSMGEAFPFLLEQAYHPRDPQMMAKTITLLKELGKRVKVFRFRSAPTPEAVHLAYETAESAYSVSS